MPSEKQANQQCASLPLYRVLNHSMIKHNIFSSKKSWRIVDFTASAHLPKPANHWPTTFQLLRHNNKETSAASPSVIPVATGIPSPFRHPVAGNQEWSACGARVFRIYNANTRVTLTRHSRRSGNPEPVPTSKYVGQCRSGPHWTGLLGWEARRPAYPDQVF